MKEKREIFCILKEKTLKILEFLVLANFKRILASLRIHIQVAPAEIIERKGKFYNELILKVPRDAIVVRKTECVMIKQSVIVILVLKMLIHHLKIG